MVNGGNLDTELFDTDPAEPIDAPVVEEASPFRKNHAKGLDKAVLQNIGRVVVEDYKSDLGSRHHLDERMNKWRKLYDGLKEIKDTPWPNAANIKLPILSTACLQFHARIYDALLPPKEIAKCWSTDGKTEEQAERCQNYLNYQLTEQMDEWLEDTDIALLLMPIYGTVVKKTFFDFSLNRPVSRALRLDEFVAPYGVKRLEDAPRKTQIYDMYLNNIRIKERDGLWINLEGVKDTEPGTPQNVPAHEHKESADKATGVQPSGEAKDRPRKILEQHRTWSLDGNDVERHYAITVDLETANVLRIESLEYDDQTTGKTKVFEYFTAFPFIPNPDSWMGTGYGHFLEHLNEAANSLTNQLLDSGTLANNISGLYDSRSNIDDGDLQFDLGQFNAVNASVDDLRKAIFVFDFNPPSQVLFTLLAMIQNYAKELSSVTDAMLGKLPPSDTTATSMLTVMEQGLKLPSTIGKRTHRNLKKELKKIVILNSYYIEEDIYYMVQDSTGTEMVRGFLGKDDFSNNIDVIPISDPNITSRSEKLIKAKSAYDAALQSKSISSNPESMYWVEREYFDALEVKNIDQILPKPEPPQPPPDLRPEQEEAEFLAERDTAILPQQDHLAHLNSHRAFEGSEFAQFLTPQGKKLLEGHIRETTAQAYLQIRQSGEAAQNEQAIEGSTQGLGVEPGLEGAGAGFGAGTDVNSNGFVPQG